MFVGHLAAGALMKAHAPETKALPIMLGVGWLDVVDGLNIAATINDVTPDLDAGPYLFFDLTHIDWDHSVFMAVLLSIFWGVLFRRDRKVALLAAAAAFSHFILDWPVHNDDLAIYPNSDAHIGLGLWGQLGTWSWVLEGVLIAVFLLLAWRQYRPRGVNMVWATAIMAVLFVTMSPWLSVMKQVAKLSEPWADTIHGILVFLGSLVPGLLLAWLIDRAESRALSDVS